MRSGLIFSVSTRISNRFLLCRMLSAGARKMHRDGVSTSECINSSLLALHEGSGDKAPRQPPTSPPDVDVDVMDQQAEETAQEAVASES